MNRIFFGAILLAMFSCSKNGAEDFVKYVEGRQLLTLNEIKRNGEEIDKPNINLVTPDSAQIGKEFLVKIFLSDTDLKITNAFVGCENVDNASVDTVTFEVSGCKHGLIVSNDTIFIAFEPTSPGVKTFSDITILTQDTENLFRTMKYKFDYRVAEN